MPSLNLNGKTVSFEPGQTILEAARGAGIDIPTLC
jgi:NADH dehydrogenase/NADH:ubiquinone oxidoreductase subunit G